MGLRSSVAALVLATALAGCSTGPTPLSAGASPTPAPGPTTAPRPHSKLSNDPRTLASDLTSTYAEVRREIGAMTAEGRTRPNLHLLLEGLHEQRIYRTIAGDKKLARRVQRHLHGSVAAATHANLRASHDLRSLVTPRKHAPKFKLAKPDAPGRLRRYYKAGQRRFGIKWQILAALNFVESKFGRVLGPSSSGAEGPMQFLPSTWKQYGNGGNIWDPHDSIIAAARYLHASGGPRDMHDALYAYNRSRAYVDAILTYARRMETKTINYYDYWLWQAFAITTHGDVQLTGPGSRQRH